MRILIAPDKFKGSATSVQVCDAIEKGLRSASPVFEIMKCPMADGGDGLSEVVSWYTGARPEVLKVYNPLFETIDATYLLSNNGRTAFIEMTKASGLALLDPSQYNPEKTTTYGTGQLVRAALQNGVSEIIIGIGGSATNDCGMGMASAVGYRFLDKEGALLSPVGENLLRVHSIDTAEAIVPALIKFIVACDVRNPLCGDNGAARVYSRQKGATPEMTERLEEGALHFAGIIKKTFGIDVLPIAGGGAAGGLGAGCVAFLGAEIKSGIELMMDLSGLKQQMEKADLVITGEGKLDNQTLEGKVIAGIGVMAREMNKSVVAFCGSNTIEPGELAKFGITATFSIVNGPVTLEKAMEETLPLLEQKAYSLGLLMIALNKK
jgi:glycerate kinase